MSGSGTSGFGISFPLNINQTPVSSARQIGDVSTGPFFAGIPSQPQFQGPGDLVGGGFVTAGGGVSGVITFIAAALVMWAIVRGGTK